jgi:hypothetical protein
MEWLQGEQIEMPHSVSRYPTLEELMDALHIFDGQAIEKRHGANEIWEVIVGDLSSTTYAHMLGSVGQNGLYDFHFWGSGCQPTTMVSLLKQLSTTCGPLIWYDHMAAIPLLVTSEIAVDVALIEWNQRWNKSESPNKRI